MNAGMDISPKAMKEAIKPTKLNNFENDWLVIYHAYL